MKKLAKFTRAEMEAGVSAKTVVRSLLGVGGNVGVAHLGIRSTISLFRYLANVLEKKLSKSAN